MSAMKKLIVAACLVAGCDKPPPQAPAPKASVVLEFRVVGEKPARVFIDGREAGATPLAWTVHPEPAFDPSLKPDSWPPHGGRDQSGGRGSNSGISVALDIAVVDGVLYLRKDVSGHVTMAGARVSVVGADGSKLAFDTVEGESSTRPGEARLTPRLWFK